MKEWLVVSLIFSGFFSFAVGIYAFKRKEESSALAFSALMMACAVHAVGYGFELFLESETSVMLWVKVEYIGISFFPFLLVWLVYSQKNDECFKNNLILILFFSVSLTTFFLVQTNSFHHLYYKAVEVDFTETINRVKFIKGPWYYVHTLFTFCAFIYTVVHTLTLYFKSKAFYKMKALNSLIVLMIPLIACIFYLLGLTPRELDVLPFFYSLVGLVWFLGAKTYGIADLIPVTYKKIFEQISEGVVVLDEHNFIVNFNKAAYNIFKPIQGLQKGCDFKLVLNLLNFKKNVSDESEHFEIIDKNKAHIYNLKRSTLRNRQNKQVGKIFLFNDITKEAQANQMLMHFATQDGLTGIHNRRHFFNLCDDKIKTAKSENKDISFIILDIDYFKQVNDKYGHLAGDQVLRELSKICKNSLREVDIVGRYGGEEFAFLIYDSTIEVTHDIIKRMRQKINDHKFYINETNHINITVSFGIYRPDLSIESDIQIIFKKADDGLYQAKEEGRDRIVLHSESLS